MPNNNLFTHHMLFFSREATSEIYGPRVSSLSYFPSRFIFIRYYFQIYISKNQKIKKFSLQFISIYFIWRSIYQSTTIYSRQFAYFWRRYPKGIDNPFNTSGCKSICSMCAGTIYVMLCGSPTGLITFV